jgi:hypothetical protein
VAGLDRDKLVIKTFVQGILLQWNLGAGLVDCRSQEHDPAVNPICDIVGTGGEGFNTFNVSTTAAIMEAGAGVNVLPASWYCTRFLGAPPSKLVLYQPV